MCRNINEIALLRTGPLNHSFFCRSRSDRRFRGDGPQSRFYTAWVMSSGCGDVSAASVQPREAGLLGGRHRWRLRAMSTHLVPTESVGAAQRHVVVRAARSAEVGTNQRTARGASHCPSHERYGGVIGSSAEAGVATCPSMARRLRRQPPPSERWRHPSDAPRSAIQPAARPW